MRSVALIGGGPAALFVLKRLLALSEEAWRIEIFESSGHLGRGMPYSEKGATRDHITNVSANELPELPETLDRWVRSLPSQLLEEYGLRRESFDEDKVLPRLLFGRYLEEQFHALLRQASELGHSVKVRLACRVIDMRDLPESDKVEVVTSDGEWLCYDQAVVCIGHRWPDEDEDRKAGYFSSPYPPEKLEGRFNHRVALRGSSLTAVDAVRTLARNNGRFERDADGRLMFTRDADCPKFGIVMHSRNGLLPCVRFYLEDPQVTDVRLLSRDEYEDIRQKHDGFIPLDMVFEEDFKRQLTSRDPALSGRINSMTMEQFVDAAMRPRVRKDPFELFRSEYQEGRQSVREDDPIPWKEALSILSFSMNYPAKHFCAEDMLRMKSSLLPLIAVVIAFLPHRACEEMIALHAAGCLEIVEVGTDSEMERAPEGGIVYRYSDQLGEWREHAYQSFVDCVGQPALEWDELPFSGLLQQDIFSQARARFRDRSKGEERWREQPDEVERDEDGEFHLLLPGIAINDAFRPLDRRGRAHPRLSMMAVPYMGGHNPDYSGVDFCEEASLRIVESMLDRAVPSPA